MEQCCILLQSYLFYQKHYENFPKNVNITKCNLFGLQLCGEVLQMKPKVCSWYLKVLWWLLWLMETLLTARYLWRWCNTHLHPCIVCLCGSEHRWPLLWSFFSVWLQPTPPFSILLFSISSSLYLFFFISVTSVQISVYCLTRQISHVIRTACK